MQCTVSQPQKGCTSIYNSEHYVQYCRTQLWYHSDNGTWM